jgi:predicted transcriptional regulator
MQKLISLKEPLIILEGSFNPEFVVNAMKDYGKNDYLIFCIHVDQKIREERLLTIRNQPELVNQDMENFAQFLKKKTQEIGGIVIENNGQSINRIAEKMIRIIKNKLHKDI